MYTPWKPLVIALLAALSGGLVSACSEVSGVPINIRIAQVTILHTCSDVVPFRSCILEAEARNSDGDVIENPALVWTSLDPKVASVTGHGESAVVCGRTLGFARIEARGAISGASDTHTVAVIQQHLPAPGNCR